MTVRLFEPGADVAFEVTSGAGRVMEFGTVVEPKMQRDGWRLVEIGESGYRTEVALTNIRTVHRCVCCGERVALLDDHWVDRTRTPRYCPRAIALVHRIVDVRL